MAIITPAIAGPFDLGAVVVRAGLYVNESTAKVTVKSDSLPRILHGFPLDVRSVAVRVHFTSPGYAARAQLIAPAPAHAFPANGGTEGGVKHCVVK